MRTYDPFREPPVAPITHLCANARWYAFKWVTARGRWHELLDLTDRKNHSVATYTQNHDSKLGVASVMKHLPEQVALILEWVHIKEYTPKEIADHLGRPLREVREEISFALELARDYQGL